MRQGNRTLSQKELLQLAFPPWLPSDGMFGVRRLSRGRRSPMAFLALDGRRKGVGGQAEMGQAPEGVDDDTAVVKKLLKFRSGGLPLCAARYACAKVAG